MDSELGACSGKSAEEEKVSKHTQINLTKVKFL